jgi:hypothetical protein
MYAAPRQAPGDGEEVMSRARVSVVPVARTIRCISFSRAAVGTARASSKGATTTRLMSRPHVPTMRPPAAITTGEIQQLLAAQDPILQS